MTHLFMETRLENADRIIPGTDIVLNATRTGEAVTLVQFVTNRTRGCFPALQQDILFNEHPKPRGIF